jgi:hypothetical protein
VGEFDEERPWRRLLPDEPPVVAGLGLEGFFAARDDEIDRAVVEEGPHGRVVGFAARNIDEVDLAALGEILDADNHGELMGRMQDGARYGASGEYGVFRVAPELTHRLTGPWDARDLAARWIATGELPVASADDIRRLLDSMRLVAIRARMEGRELWFRRSL